MKFYSLIYMISCTIFPLVSSVSAMRWVQLGTILASMIVCSNHWFPKTPNVLFFRLHYKSLQVTRAEQCETDVLRCGGRFSSRATCRLVLYREAGAAWVMPAGQVGSFRYCRCLPAWRGIVCHRPNNPCTTASCVDGRRCVRNPHSAVGFSCRCTDGSGGDRCGPAAARSPRLAGVGACRDRPCGGDWTCTEDVSAPAGYTCGCDQRPGYRPASDADPTCVLADPCAAHRPCHHGGTCLSLGGDFRCQCSPAWTGHGCTMPQNPCTDAELCGHDWTCRRSANERAGYTCSCHEKAGWEPRSEDDPQCILRNVCLARAPCQNGGTCSPGPDDGFTCACASAWDGTTCDKPRDPCRAAEPCGETWKCRRDPTSTAGFVCDCESRPGWTATSEEDPRCMVSDHCLTGSPCQNGGTCRYLSPGAFSCQCRPAWTDRTCDTPRDPCGGSATCGAGWPCRRDASAAAGYSCACDLRPGWRAVSAADPSCLLVEHCKAKSPCGNGGTCVPTLEDGVAGFQCVCPPVWGGQVCAAPRNPCAAGDARCGPGWSCRRDVSSKVGFSCGCSGRRGWRPRSPDDPTCVQADLCRVRRPCRNGGKCGPGSVAEPYTCRCRGAWQGPLCQKPRDPCRQGAPCGDGAACSRRATSLAGFTCHCDQRPGYSARSAAEPRCVLSDTCRALAPCLHGGTCSSLGTGRRGFTCRCAAAWSGAACEVPRDPCVHDPQLVIGVCGEKSVCSRDSSSAAGFDCDCDSRPGWRRHSSELAKCVVQDACLAVRPCRHGATCRSVADQSEHFYRCFCHPAWQAKNCTEPRDPCKEPKNSCNDGFRCRRNPEAALGYECGCDEKPGYRPSSRTNPECEVYDACLSAEPCSNGGVCFPIGEKHFFCECKKSWTGKTCDIVLVPCEGMKDPCGTKWRCHMASRQQLGYTCGCSSRPGWTSSSSDGHCMVADPCLAYAPCANGGTCSVESGEQYSCRCRPGWGGATCEAPIDPCEDGDQCGPQFTCRRDPHSVTGFTCDCESRPGWRRADDDDPRCQLYDPCLAEPPCLNGGRCLTLGGGRFSCVCPPGRRGPLCEGTASTEAPSSPPPPPPLVLEPETTPAEPADEDEGEPTPLLREPAQFRPVPTGSALAGFHRFLDELTVLAPKLKLMFVLLGLLICSVVLFLLCFLCWRQLCRRRRRDSECDYLLKKAELDRKCESYLREKYGYEPAPCDPGSRLPPCEPYPRADPCDGYQRPLELYDGPEQYGPSLPAEEAYRRYEQPYRTPSE